MDLRDVELMSMPPRENRLFSLFPRGSHCLQSRSRKMLEGRLLGSRALAGGGEHMEISKQMNVHQITLLWFKRSFKQDLRCLAGGKKMFSSQRMATFSLLFHLGATMASITVFTANVCWNGSMEKGKLSAFKVCKVNTASACFFCRLGSSLKCGPGSRVGS